MDFSYVLDQTVQNCAQVKVVADLDRGMSEDKDIFSTTSKTLGYIKTWWDQKFAAETTGPDNVALGDENLNYANMEFLDDAWLENILGLGELHYDPNMQWSNAGSGV